MDPKDGSAAELAREISRLRRTVLKHGHAQEMFQSKVEKSIVRLTESAPGTTDAAEPLAGPDAEPSLTSVQLRVLIELEQAARNLRGLAAGGGAPAEEDSPRSVREGLGLLEIRVSNLQRSFGLERIPASGRPFDDRLHRVEGVCHREDLPDGQVVEEVLPGYVLHGEVKRPAQVIVNRLRSETESPKAEEG